MSGPVDFDPNVTRARAQRALTQALAAAGIESAALDARVLLCAALGIDHAGLLRDPDLPLGLDAARLAAFAARRMKREPVSRILGQREFFGILYGVDPAVLDPRPDTETLVEAVLAAFAARKDEPLRLLDLGTGSGILLGSLLSVFEQAYGIGVDLSVDACLRARKNLDAMGLATGLAGRFSILAGRWTAPLRGRFDIVVSNPPYIRSSDIAALDPEVRLYDPRLALDGGTDGLDAYRALAVEVKALLAPRGILALEFGAGQSGEIESILRAAGWSLLGVSRDLAGRERAVLAGLESAD